MIDMIDRYNIYDMDQIYYNVNLEKCLKEMEYCAPLTIKEIEICVINRYIKEVGKLYFHRTEDEDFQIIRLNLQRYLKDISNNLGVPTEWLREKELFMTP